MTGIERLRELGREQEERSWSTVGKVRGRLMLDIADQIERERAKDCHRMGLDHGAVSRVVSDMERHVSGVEGMEDSPVARWARELRAALEAREAVGPGGARRRGELCEGLLEAVCAAVTDERADLGGAGEEGVLSVARDAIGEAERAREVRALWPRYGDGGPLRIGGETLVGGVGVVKVSSVEVGADGFDLRGRLDGEEMGGSLHLPAGTLLRRPGEDSWALVLRDAGAGRMTAGELESRARALAGRLAS